MWSMWVWVRKRCACSSFWPLRWAPSDPQPGAGVEDQALLAAHDLDARRVATVTQRLGARARHGAAHAPESDPKLWPFTHGRSRNRISRPKTRAEPPASNLSANHAASYFTHVMVEEIALGRYPRRRRVRDQRRRAQRLVGYHPGAWREQGRQSVAKPRRQLCIARRVAGTDVEVRQSRGAGQTRGAPAARSRAHHRGSNARDRECSRDGR